MDLHADAKWLVNGFLDGGKWFGKGKWIGILGLEDGKLVGLFFYFLFIFLLYIYIIINNMFYLI